MLASITPLGERGRRSTWGVTVTAFALGATLAGAAAGAAVAWLGALVLPGAADSRARLAVLAAALLIALALDAIPRAVPGPRRSRAMIEAGPAVLVAMGCAAGVVAGLRSAWSP